MVRYFSIEDEQFIQKTQLETAFGEALIITLAPLTLSFDEPSKTSVSIHQTVLYDSDVPFEVRISEMEHFLEVFRLFNPKVISEYEKEISPLFPSSE